MPESATLDEATASARASDERRRRAETLVEVLSETSRIVSGSLELSEVFARVAEPARRLIRFDAMGVTRIEPDGSLLFYALAGDAAVPKEGRVVERAQVSKALWPEPFDGPRRVDDAPRELDPAFGLDRQVVERGRRSLLFAPLRRGDALLGALWFSSNEVRAYAAADEAALTGLASLMALALAHHALAEEARRAAEAHARAAFLESRVERLVAELESRDGFQRIVGVSKSWRDVLVQATKVATTETTVLLTGESGTGKEILARAIHRASPRASGPFVALNCAALPDQLLESELFGYERGAFTGATAAKPGRLELAAKGVLFLDECGEMSPVVQAKLLRVLQEKEFQRLGGTRPIQADVRILAATNRDLPTAIQRGEFREDLYYRLHVFEIALPPLRERREDILPLTERFLDELGRAVGRPAPGISREARDLLLAYSWPGNVRELRNALERALILCDGELVNPEHLPISVARAGAPAAPEAGSGLAALPAGGVDLEELEKALVGQALARAKGNKSRAARLLGLSRAQLYTRLEKYGLSPSGAERLG